MLKGLARRGSGVIGLSIVVIYIVITVFSPLLSPHDPNEFDMSAILQRPSQAHPFGTDALGRDVLSRTLQGGRVAIPVTIGATLLAMMWAGATGIFLALAGGKLDELFMRIVDVLLSIPRLLFLLMVASALGSGSPVLLFTLAFLYGIPVIRVARAATLEFVALEFITAARARGENRWGIIFHELAPNIQSVLIVEASMRWSAMLLAFSSLSFLGFGVAPPQSDWGLMIAMSRGVLAVAPWATLFPVAAITILVIGINLLANAIAAMGGVEKTLTAI